MTGGFLKDDALLQRVMMIQTCAEVFNKHNAPLELKKHSYIVAEDIIQSWNELKI